MYSVKANFPADYTEESLMTLSEALFDITDGSSARRADNDHENAWIIEWYCAEGITPVPAEFILRLSIQGKIRNIPMPLKEQDLIVAEVPDENWLEKVYEQLAPFSVGPFYIYGSHVKDAPPEGQIPLLIDAATAFGSGEHGTTKGCLQAMLDLKGRGICPWNVLDMGTGSGILAIAAYKLWHTPITAVDIEEESVRVAGHYRDMNSVPEGKTGMLCAAGDGFRTEIVQERKPFDLIIANILAGPLKDMVADLIGVADKNAYVILSGMLIKQADEVLAVYEQQGCTLKSRFDIGKWSTLVLHKE